MTAPVYWRRFWVAASLMVAFGLIATGCSSSGGAAPTAAASSSNNSLILPTPPGTVPDSIDDVNSSKDMTGVVTTLSGSANPYFALIPKVCPLLPDSLTRDKLGMVDRQTDFGPSNKLLQVCVMQGESGPQYQQLGVTVTMQATSIADVNASPTHTTLNGSVPVWRGMVGTLYQNKGDVGKTIQYCNLAWGTFYGSAVVTVSVDSGFPADPCVRARDFAPLIAPYLPTKPIQMRP